MTRRKFFNSIFAIAGLGALASRLEPRPAPRYYDYPGLSEALARNFKMTEMLRFKNLLNHGTGEPIQFYRYEL